MARPPRSFEVEEALSADGFREQRPGVYADVDDEAYDPSLEWHENIDVTIGNKDLPIFEFKQQIVDTVRANPVTIIVAETGAGKSTQVPQFLAEAVDGYSTIYLTQPRRTAARSVATRIRDEWSQVRGLAAGWDIVNYQTAGDTDGPEDARIQVVTDGLQLVREFHDHGVKDNDVLIIDEAHEWNTNVELLLAWAKQEIPKNPNLRVIIKSATLDSKHLAEYFSDVCDQNPPIIEVPGRSFGVAWNELPETTVTDKIMSIISSIPAADGTIPEGFHSILAFEPGKREIYDAIDEVRRRLPPALRKDVIVLPLHAKLTKEQQDEALKTYPGKIKVILSTDVAQTSITIEDITHVVDGGFKRHIEVDDEGTPGLKMIAISQADCKQRAGRTGRVAEGNYYLVKLNNNTPFVPFSHRDTYSSPEITRTDVSRNALRLKDLNLDISDFDMYHKASRHIIGLAMNSLTILQALDEESAITSLGKEMNAYPSCTSSARIMVESRRYSEPVRDYLARIVAAKEAGGLQYFAHNVGKKWQELTEEDLSDFMVQLDLFMAAETMTKYDMKEYDMDIDNFTRAMEQYPKIARHAGVKESVHRPPTTQEREDIMNCIYAGFITSVYKHIGNGQYVHAYNNEWPTIRELSNRSMVRGQPLLVVGDPYRVDLIDGGEIASKHYIENVSVVTAQQLGAVAINHTEWVHEEYKMRGDKMKDHQRQYLFGMDLGIVHEADVVPSPRLREQIIHHALEHPGASQQAIRDIKTKLEHLSHLSNSPLPKITHDQIIELVQECAPDDITNPAEIEDNLRMILLDPDRRLSLDDLVSPEKRHEIRENAPPQLEVDGVSLHLRYRNSVPIVSRYDAQAVLKLNDEVYLSDGRHVLFSLPGDSKKYTLYQLQAKLADE